jgi:hypothetical protein
MKELATAQTSFDLNQSEILLRFYERRDLGVGNCVGSANLKLSPLAPEAIRSR